MNSEPSLNHAQRKYQKRKQKQHDKKLLKRNAGDEVVNDAKKDEKSQTSSLQVEYVAADPIAELDESDPNYGEFVEVFRRFGRISKELPSEEQDNRATE